MHSSPPPSPTEESCMLHLALYKAYVPEITHIKNHFDWKSPLRLLQLLKEVPSHNMAPGPDNQCLFLISEDNDVLYYISVNRNNIYLDVYGIFLRNVNVIAVL